MYRVLKLNFDQRFSDRENTRSLPIEKKTYKLAQLALCILECYFCKNTTFSTLYIYLLMKLSIVIFLVFIGVFYMFQTQIETLLKTECRNFQSR